MYADWKVKKELIYGYDNPTEEQRKEMEEAQNEYSKVAEWCNQGQEYHIEDTEDGYFSVVKNPEPTKEDLLKSEMYELQRYLSETDYITNKLAEVVDDMEAYEAMKAKYSEQLTKRAEARVRIREIEKETADEESASE